MTYQKITMKSQQDDTVNLIEDFGQGQVLETRIAERTSGTLILYFSVGLGCRLACRFCHLTATGQTNSLDLDSIDYESQLDFIKTALEWDPRRDTTTTLHINFMARGDLLNSQFFLKNGPYIFSKISRDLRTFFYNPIDIQFKISTIFPKTTWNWVRQKEFNTWCQDLIIDPLTKYPNSTTTVEFYYSLYSLDYRFRKKWIPNGQNPADVGEYLRGSRDHFRLHHPLIEKQNDWYEDAAAIHSWLKTYDIVAGVNLIDYNPYSEKQGKGSSDVRVALYTNLLRDHSHISFVNSIKRIGNDVYASCGQFYSK